MHSRTTSQDRQSTSRRPHRPQSHAGLDARAALEVFSRVRTLIPILLISFVVSCSGTKGRLRHVTSAKSEAHAGGARQAQDFASVVHQAYLSGDYAKRVELGVVDANDVIATIERVLPTAGVDTPTLLAWRAIMLLDMGRRQEGSIELNRSFEVGPNELAGTMLIDAAGQQNRPDLVGPLCARTVPAVRTDEGKLALIARCRKRMNALSVEGEMVWMSPELVAWYQGENANRLHAVVDADNARIERKRQEQSVVHGMEQCSASCKEQGLYCQNDCRRDHKCENRCVEINHACLDSCESRAHEALGR